MGRWATRQWRLGVPVTLYDVKLNEEGYDMGGAYWGIPSNLWLVEDDMQTVHEFFRADTEARAEQIVRQRGGVIKNVCLGVM